MSLPYNSTEKLAGLLLILMLILVLAATLFLGGGREWFDIYDHYYALYNEGYSLSPGVKVKFLRTDVGRVTRLELTANNKVKVHLAILRDFSDRVKTDSIAAVESPTFIGSEYIDIIPGSLNSPVIPPGGQIPARERKSINDLIQELRLVEKLNLFEEILTDVASLTHQLQDPGGPLLGALANVRKVTAQVSEGEGSLGRFLNHDSIYQETEKILISLASATSDISRITGDVSRTTAELQKTMPEILAEIQKIIGQLELAVRSAPEISRDARESLRSVHQVLDSAKRNILIRGNLPEQPDPDSLTYPARSE